jgi:hypothetical protein
LYERRLTFKQTRLPEPLQVGRRAGPPLQVCGEERVGLGQRAAVTMVDSPGYSETATLSQLPLNRSVPSVSDISAASVLRS